MLHLYWIDVTRRNVPPPPPPPKPFSPESLLRCPVQRAGSGRGSGPVGAPLLSRPRQPPLPPPPPPAAVERRGHARLSLSLLRRLAIRSNNNKKIAQASSARTATATRTFNGSSFAESAPPGSGTRRGGRHSRRWVFCQRPSFVSRRSL